MRNVRGASGSTGLAGLGDFWWSLDFVALARMGDKSPQRDRPTTPDANLRIRRDYLGIYTKNSVRINNRGNQEVYNHQTPIVMSLYRFHRECPQLA